MQARYRVMVDIGHDGYVTGAAVAKWLGDEKLTETVIGFEPFDEWEDLLGQVRSTLDFQGTLW